MSSRPEWCQSGYICFKTDDAIKYCADVKSCGGMFIGGAVLTIILVWGLQRLFTSGRRG